MDIDTLETTDEKLASLHERILSLVGEYVALRHQQPVFTPGVDYIPPSGKVFDASEVRHLIDSSLEFWLTAGRYNQRFEKAIADFLGIKHAITTNSGSSANLLALSALTSPQLKKNRLRPGSEVITVAAGFPTTVNPVILQQMVPVFIDIDLPTYNIDVSQLENAYSEKTGAVMVAHTLGNPFDLDAVKTFTEQHDLWLIEDCCDALGSTYQDRYVGTFGDIATCSFYPAHHITMGEGGALFTNQGTLRRIIESFRDWGRDCHCLPGKDNTCGKRFAWQAGELPFGYDHKYIYSHLGFNLKITDMQAAIALAQLEKLPTFIAQRKHNFARLHTLLSDLQDHLVLPQATAGAEPAWFGFPITLRHGNTDDRTRLLIHLEKCRIGTRLLFGGNLTRQPYFKDLPYRVATTLKNTDTVMQRSFWIGVYPGINEPMLEYIAACFHDYFKNG